MEEINIIAEKVRLKYQELIACKQLIETVEQEQAINIQDRHIGILLEKLRANIICQIGEINLEAKRLIEKGIRNG